MVGSSSLSLTPPISEPDSSSEQSSCTFTIDSDDGLRRPRDISSGTWLDPSQVACQHISDHQSAISSGLRSSAVSHENSDDEDPHDPIGDAVTGTREDSIDSNREMFRVISAHGYSHTTKLPQQSTISYLGNMLKNPPNRPHPPYETTTKPRKSTNIVKHWRWEVFNCVLAIGILESMYIILQHYDGQRMPDWGTSINLSTLIALMATLLRTMLAFVVSVIIGQAKWNYFAGGGRPEEMAPVRRLVETSRFNDASQGLLGAVKLLPTIIRDPPTLMAVIVMIVSLGTGSFVQQAIQTQPCQFPVESAKASLPITRRITIVKEGGGGSLFEAVDLSNTAAAVSSALAPESEEIGSPISVECRTGNCTFQNTIDGVYSTLGMCSSCADVSSLITSTEWAQYSKYCGYQRCPRFTANITLPNGMSVADNRDNITFTNTQATEMLVSNGWGLDWVGDLASQDMKAFSYWALENVTILAPNWLSESSGYLEFVAASCTLYPCLRSYTGAVRSGRLEEVLVGTAPAVPDIAGLYMANMMESTQDGRWREFIYTMEAADFKAVQSPCLVNDTVWAKENKSSTLDTQRLLLLHADVDPGGAPRFTVENITAPPECIYSLGARTTTELMSMEGFTFNGSCSINKGGDAGIYAGNSTVIGCGETFWLASFLEPNGTTAGSLIKRIESFTDRLSNKMRMGFFNDPETVTGQVLQMTVCSRIHYSWLAFPAVLVGVTSGLLAWTMFRSSRRRGREMAWKSSILPFLFYGERFVVQNGEDVSAQCTESSRRDGAKEPLLDLNRMEAEAKQQQVRFDAFD